MPGRFTTADGFSIGWHELGATTAGIPIVLQHGFSATTASEWVDCGIAASLAGLGRRIIGIDALGHGASDRPHDARHYGEARMAADLSALVAHLGIAQYDLVGYSMGAIIALLAASSDRRVRRLVAGGVGEAVVLLGGVDTRVLDNRALAQALLADDPATMPAALRPWREGAVARGNDPRALGAHAQVVHASAIALDRIAAPTLIIAGDTDPLAAHPEVLAAAVPGAVLARIPGDHTTARLSPEFTRKVLAFLA